MSKISICYLSPRADLPVNYRAFIAPLRPLARLHCKVTYTSTPRGAHLPLTSTPFTKTSHQLTSANTIKKNRTGSNASRTEAGSCLLTNQSINLYQSLYQSIICVCVRRNHRDSALSSSDTAKLHHFHYIQHLPALMKVKTVTPLLHRLQINITHVPVRLSPRIKPVIRRYMPGGKIPPSARR